MPGVLKRYAHWLHTRWPAGTVEKLPEVGENGRTNIPGLYVTGDLTGIPLLKFSLDSGVRVVREIADDLGGSGDSGSQVLDLAIVGAGVSGMAAAMEARERGLSYRVLESAEPFFTIVNFPRKKPIYTYPRNMTPEGNLQVRAEVKEDLLAELERQVEAAGIEVTPGRVEAVRKKGDRFELEMAEGESVVARRVVVAIGRNGDFRRMEVPGEDLDKVYNRLHDPQDFCGQKAVVVGGGDSAAETAVALARCGAEVTLVYRGRELSRPKPENAEMVLALASGSGEARVEAPSSERVTAAAEDFLGPADVRGSLRLELSSKVKEIREDAVVLETPSGEKTVANDVVFAMIGREAPLGFFRRSGVRIAGEMGPRAWAALAAFMLFCTWLYNWKSGGALDKLWSKQGWFPYNLAEWVQTLDPTSLLGVAAKSATGPSFWYTLAYSAVVVVFGLKRIRKRKTPYITVQTSTLMAIQVVPLFLLPEVILPYLNYHGWLPQGFADALFPEVTYGHGREFWRAYGLILAWPLNVYNVFTAHPLPAWLWICAAQTLVLIPVGIYFFGKGVYCGWICSCGALAETLGDGFRHKMPHGPRWNRLNLLGQGVLLVAVVLLGFRIASWVLPESAWLQSFLRVSQDGGGAGGVFRLLNYKWTVDVLLAGVLGYGLYFWFSGRMWCRFACPLAALMHIYARFSRFRILPDKKKCISCNVCTSVCHQGIDVMNFANKGVPMADPECVRCSACVQSCPTGVLAFGQVDREGKTVAMDGLAASPVRMREGS